MFFDKEQFTITNYTLFKKLRQTKYSQTYSAQHNTRNNLIRIIQIIDLEILSASEIQNILQRLHKIKIINFIHIQRIVDIKKQLDPLKNKKFIYVVFQHFEGYPILEKIGQLDKHTIIKIYYQLRYCIDAIRDHNLIHGNINLESIIINSQNNICLTDFELIKQDIDSEKYYYHAPQKIILGQNQYKSDHWSIGIVLLQLILTKPLYELRKQNNNKSIELLDKHVILQKQTLSNKNALKHIIVMLLCHNPSKRRLQNISMSKHLTKVQRQEIKILKQKISTNTSTRKQTLILTNSTRLKYLMNLEAQHIESISINSTQIIRLSFFQECYFYNLKRLSLQNNKIVDLSFIESSHFQQLEVLNLKIKSSIQNLWFIQALNLNNYYYNTILYPIWNHYPNVNF